MFPDEVCFLFLQKICVVVFSLLSHPVIHVKMLRKRFWISPFGLLSSPSLGPSLPPGCQFFIINKQHHHHQCHHCYHCPLSSTNVITTTNCPFHQQIHYHHHYCYHPPPWLPKSQSLWYSSFQVHQDQASPSLAGHALFREDHKKLSMDTCHLFLYDFQQWNWYSQWQVGMIKVYCYYIYVLCALSMLNKEQNIIKSGLTNKRAGHFVIAGCSCEEMRL